MYSFDGVVRLVGSFCVLGRVREMIDRELRCCASIALVMMTLKIKLIAKINLRLFVASALELPCVRADFFAILSPFSVNTLSPHAQ
jgi:hypothetical protein